jgi:Fe-Mn family superoxide dismutase
MITLPELPYGYDALEPTMSAATLHAHHDKHHAKYVETANKLAQEAGLESRSVEALVAEAERRGLKTLFNNAAQAWNHAFFWDCMTPSRRDPGGALAAAIEAAFGGLGDLRTRFVEEGAEHFASGWVWLAADGAELAVLSTHDAGTLATDRRTPLLVCDIWEHAYYLDRKQDRKGFLEAWFDRLAHWEFAEAQFEAAQGRSQPWRFNLAA